MSAPSPLLEIRDLVVEYTSRGRTLRALNGFSLTVMAGQTVGLVGESGSGKTTVARAVLGLAPVSSGSIIFGGQDITRLRGSARRKLASDLQAVFQDPYGSMNPALPVSRIVGEPLRALEGAKPAEAASRVRVMLDRVGLPGSAAHQYPASFSGGQRQRIAIARALMPSPRLVICDEVVSSLDLSIQAQVLNLLRALQREQSLSYLFIGHDLDVVRYMAARTVVMYRGRIMEEGPAGAVARRPRHPYTQALVASTPSPDPAVRKVTRYVPAGRPEGAISGPAASGCPFAPRCPSVTGVCHELAPPQVPAPDGGLVACHRYPELSQPGAIHPADPSANGTLMNETPTS